MADDLLLDPSLFLSRSAFPIVLDALKHGELKTARIPNRFSGALRDGLFSDGVSRFFADSQEPLSAKDIMRRIQNEGVDFPKAYDPSSFRLKGTEFDMQLSEFVGDETVRQILIEEWEFLTSQSWIAAKSKRAFDAFLKGGAAAVEWGTNKFDYLAARTLKIKPEEIPDGLKPKQRLRAAAKWIVVGGSSASALLAPLAAAAGAAVAGYFMIFDP
jgi:hypothetical protein